MCSYRAACGCDHTAFNLKHFIIDGLQRRTGVAFCPPVLDMEQTKIMEMKAGRENLAAKE